MLRHADGAPAVLAISNDDEEIAVEVTTYDTDDDLLTKLGPRNRVQAVVTAYEHGLVSPGRVER